MIRKKMGETMLKEEKTPDSKVEKNLSAGQVYSKISALVAEITPHGYLTPLRNADGVFQWPQFSNKADAEAFAELALEDGVTCKLSETLDKANGDTLWQVVPVEIEIV